MQWSYSYRGSFSEPLLLLLGAEIFVRNCAYCFLSSLPTFILPDSDFIIFSLIVIHESTFLSALILSSLLIKKRSLNSNSHFIIVADTDWTNLVIEILIHKLQLNTECKRGPWRWLWKIPFSSWKSMYSFCSQDHVEIWLHIYICVPIFSEVLKALLKTRDLFESWRMGEEGRDLRSAEEQEWATTELRNSLRSIEWDLEVSTFISWITQ